MLLTAIVPVYNESKTLAILLEKLMALPCEMQIIAVDDGSTDSSPQILKSLADEKKILYLRHESNQGKGMAIRTGLDAAEGVYTIIQDADLEYDPKDIQRMLDVAVENNADAVFGSRNLHSHSEHSYRRYYLGGKFLTMLANFLYGLDISDESTCYKMVRTELMKSLNLKCRGFEFCPELVAKLARRRIKINEIPIHYHPRKMTEGKKIRWQDGAKAIATLIKYRFPGIK
ncbi:MAG: glycosyltransferase family 2 protein [FCB group bacterium]|nr:glycosyltransferase family 2 protein [FCB group bacterium]